MNASNRRRGSARVTVLPGQTVTVEITLEARASIVGRVLDADGAPVPRATVRLPKGDGYTFVFANNDGVFKFPDLTLGDYLIQAPGPPQEALIPVMIQAGMDPKSAFTSGDMPPELLDDEVDFSDTNQALEAYQNAVQTFFSVVTPGLQEAAALALDEGLRRHKNAGLLVNAELIG